jgi:hypothetical protein
MTTDDPKPSYQSQVQDRLGRPSRLAEWITARKAAGTAEAPIIYIRPADNVIIGLRPLLEYLHIRSPNTLYQWVELYGFPAIKRPDGQWFSTITSIDQWVFLACQADAVNRPHSRGYTARHDIAKERLERRVGERGLRIARGEQEAAKSGVKPNWSKTPGS